MLGISHDKILQLCYTQKETLETCELLLIIHTTWDNPTHVKSSRKGKISMRLFWKVSQDEEVVEVRKLITLSAIVVMFTQQIIIL